MLKRTNSFLRIPYLRDARDEGCRCCASVLHAGTEDLPSVKVTAVRLEDSCYADGVVKADGAGEGGVVVFETVACLFGVLFRTFCQLLVWLILGKWAM